MSFILKFTQAGVTTFNATIVAPSLFSPGLDELENWPRREMGGTRPLQSTPWRRHCVTGKNKTQNKAIKC